MKAISLYQPWAALVAAGEKKIETRSWYTNHRGPLAIHASKRIPPEYRSLWLKEPFLSALKRAGVVAVEPGSILGGLGFSTSYSLLSERLYLGHVIAVCKLTACVRIPERAYTFPVDDRLQPDLNKLFVRLPPPSPELNFGDYTPGRYAWILNNVRPLADPVPARGRQRLWEWAPEPTSAD